MSAYAEAPAEATITSTPLSSSRALSSSDRKSVTRTSIFSVGTDCANEVLPIFVRSQSSTTRLAHSIILLLISACWMSGDVAPF